MIGVERLTPVRRGGGIGPRATARAHTARAHAGGWNGDLGRLDARTAGARRGRLHGSGHDLLALSEVHGRRGLIVPPLAAPRGSHRADRKEPRRARAGHLAARIALGRER